MRGAAAVAVAIMLGAGGEAHAKTREFVPRPASEPRFAVASPVATKVPGGSGESIHMDTWLPAAKDGHVPPARLPSVLLYSPYETAGSVRGSYGEVRDALVSRGYAFSVAHMPGTGASTGCEVLGGRAEQEAGARVVEYLGERAPWASGHVGMYGGSASGGSALGVAAGPDRARLETLDAIVPYAPTASLYDFFHHDGVPHLLQAGVSTIYDGINNGAVTGTAGLTADPAGRVACQGPEFANKAASLGDYAAHYEESDRHLDSSRITAAVLMAHGHADPRVSSLTQAGLFDRLPGARGRAGIFMRSSHSVPLTQLRPDWIPLVTAWFDHWLKGLDTGADGWPVAQVQTTDGRWRAQPRWPAAEGAKAQLALGDGGALGVAKPSGETAYLESALEVRQAGYRYPEGTAAVFETGPVEGPLELVGSPVLDAWVRLDRPDAHVAVKLEALGPDGEPTAADAMTMGARSAQHLHPMPRDHFTQASGVLPPVGRPLHVPVRFNPTDLVVPRGGRLRLTIAGSVIAYDGLDGAQKGLGAPFFGPTMPSGAATNVTVLHDCAHPTTLRFVVPDPEDDLLVVDGRRPPPAAAADGGGIARERVCGKRPVRPSAATRR